MYGVFGSNDTCNDSDEVKFILGEDSTAFVLATVNVAALLQYKVFSAT